MDVRPFSVLLTLKSVEIEGIMTTIRLLLPFLHFLQRTNMVLYPVLCIRKNIVYQRKCNLFTHVSTWITLLKIKYCYRSKYFHPEFIFFPLILKTTSKTEYALCKRLFSPLALLFFSPEILVCVVGGGSWMIYYI